MKSLPYDPNVDAIFLEDYLNGEFELEEDKEYQKLKESYEDMRPEEEN